MTDLKIGDEVRTTGSETFFGELIPVGSRGVVKDLVYHLVNLVSILVIIVEMKDGRIFSLAPDEIELVPRLALIEEIRDSLAELGISEKTLALLDKEAKDDNTKSVA